MRLPNCIPQDSSHLKHTCANINLFRIHVLHTIHRALYEAPSRPMFKICISGCYTLAVCIPVSLAPASLATHIATILSCTWRCGRIAKGLDNINNGSGMYNRDRSSKMNQAMIQAMNVLLFIPIVPPTVIITVKGAPPPGFTPGSPTEYRAASGPYTFTCTATGGAGIGNYDYVWTSTCVGCDFQTSSTGTTSEIFRQALHSGDNGTHTCTATRAGESGSDTINVTVAGEHYF